MRRARLLWVGLGLLTLLPGLLLRAWQAAPARGQSAGSTTAKAPARPAEVKPEGFNIAPVTNVADPYPTWNSVAVDPVNNVVLFSDLNRHGLFIYDRMAQSKGDEVTPALKHITGNKTGMGFVAGIQFDPAKRVAYIAENDGWGLRTFSYDQDGNVEPKNLLATPHQVWGIALNTDRKEMLVGVEELHTIMVWRQDASQLEKPLRIIRGSHTGLADPHGLYMDSVHNEILVANHGNWSTFHPNTDHDTPPPQIPISPGHFEQPSISFYPILGDGDIKPSRVIQGDKTTLDWPMQLDVDLAHNEIAVADFGQDSIVVFDRAAQGNVAPVRILKGEHTGIIGPVGVAIDTKNDEIWVANYGDHTAVVFPRTASGDVAPKRIIRNAPKSAETCGFTNASSATYDSKREQVLVAN